MEQMDLGLLFERLGGPVKLEKAGQVHHYRAVLQPVRDRSKQFLERTAGRFGWEDGGHVLYYGPSSNGGEMLESGDELVSGGERYLVKRCEPYFFQGEPVYRWAVLVRATEEELE